MVLPQNKIDPAMLEQLKELLEDRFPELVDRFIEDGGQRIDLLKDAVPSRNYETIHAESHGLKGSSRNIGANTLGQVCGDLESLGRQKNDADIETLLAAVEQEFAAVCLVLADA